MPNVSLICGIKNKTNLTEQKETDRYREETRVTKGKRSWWRVKIGEGD